jgi:hypothetical protein
MPPRALAISAPMPLCVAVFAPCGLLLPLFFPLLLIPSFFLCPPHICGATRPFPPVIFIYFSISFSDLFHFSSPPPSGGCFRASSPICGFFFYSLALLAHVQYDVLYKFLQMAGGFPKVPALLAACFAR